MRPLIRWVRQTDTGRLVRGLFLDRDGVLNEHVLGGYVLKWSDFVWIPGVIESLAELVQLELPIVIVTNQSCIGRGLVSAESIIGIMEGVVDALEAAGVRISAWYCCPHSPTDGCSCRKPLPGMLSQAAADMNIDLKSSYLIGDSDTDIAAGGAVGCATWKINAPAEFRSAIAEIAARERLIAGRNEVLS